MSVLQVNQKINLAPLEKKGHSCSLTTYVAEVNEKHLFLAVPIYKGSFFTFPRGQELKLWFAGAGALYSFTSRVVDHVSGDCPLLVLELPTEIIRRQRRRFVRIEFTAPARIEILPELGSQFQRETGRWAEGFIVDIGGGGVRLVADKEVNADTMVAINLDKFPVNRLAGRVVRCRPSQQSKGFWDWAVEFSGVTSRDRDLIIKFIFKRQRELRRKGLL